MVKEVVSRSARRTTLTLPHRSRGFVHHFAASQRRHVSNGPEPSSSIQPDLSWDPVQTLRLDIEAQTRDFDLDVSWEHLVIVLDADLLSRLEVLEILEFCDKLLERVEQDYDSSVGAEILHEWSRRVEKLLKTLDSRITHHSPDDLWQRYSLSRVSSLRGEIEGALSLIHSTESLPFTIEERAAAAGVRAYECVMMSVLRYRNALHVLDLILSEWTNVAYYLSRAGSYDISKLARNKGGSFRDCCFSILTRIEHPGFLLSRREDWDNETRKQVGDLLIDAYLNEGLVFDAHETLVQLRALGITLPIIVQLKVVRALVKEDARALARELFTSIPHAPRFQGWLSTALYMHAHNGENMQAEYFYNRLAEEGWADDHDKCMFIQSYATNGRADLAVQLFNRFYPKTAGGTRHTLNILPYSIVIHAHSKRGDIAGINTWLEELSAAGYRPDAYIYTMILQAFAMRGDMDSIATVFRQMQGDGIAPTVVTYITIITLLAHRKDPVGAEELYKRAIMQGINPSRRLISAVMNAHVEAGSWRGVIRAFDYIKLTPRRNIRITIEVYNTLLKAYVMIGTPFDVVLKLYTKLESAKVKPDSYTFALLIQSACDNGQMQIAEDIFMEMDKLATNDDHNVDINVYVLTIIMSGYLRFGDQKQAREVFDAMEDRGIMPTAVTFTTILKMYSSQRTEEGLQLAEEFIGSLLADTESRKTWDIPSHGRKSVIQALYAPVIRGYTNLQRTADVERVFQEMLNQGGEPSLGSLTALLDVYRRTGNVDAVLQLWPQIFQIGLKYARDQPLFETSFPNVSRSQANVLGVPLSIYIDALSAAGYHTEIAAVWKNFQVNKLTFDSHNWNHLAVALVRAGEPERAFQVVEKILLPYQRKSSHLQSTRVEKPKSPLVFDDPENTDPIPDHLPPGHTRTRRIELLGLNKTKLYNAEEINKAMEDFVHPLFILHNISPLWSIWRPHSATLLVLQQVLQHLMAGGVITATTSNEASQGTTAISPEEMLRHREISRQMLERIYANYPETVKILIEMSRLRKWR